MDGGQRSALLPARCCAGEMTGFTPPRLRQPHAHTGARTHTLPPACPAAEVCEDNESRLDGAKQLRREEEEEAGREGEEERQRERESE